MSAATATHPSPDPVDDPADILNEIRDLLIKFSQASAGDEGGLLKEAWFGAKDAYVRFSDPGPDAFEDLTAPPTEGQEETARILVAHVLGLFRHRGVPRHGLTVNEDALADALGMVELVERWAVGFNDDFLLGLFVAPMPRNLCRLLEWFEAYKEYAAVRKDPSAAKFSPIINSALRCLTRDVLRIRLTSASTDLEVVLFARALVVIGGGIQLLRHSNAVIASALDSRFPPAGTEKDREEILEALSDAPLGPLAELRAHINRTTR